MPSSVGHLQRLTLRRLTLRWPRLLHRDKCQRARVCAGFLLRGKEVRGRVGMSLRRLRRRVLHLPGLRVRGLPLRSLTDFVSNIQLPRARASDGTPSFLAGSDRSTGHPPAFFGTLLACLGAPLAMIDLVLAALRAAGFANLRANAADILHKPRIPAHKGRSRPADLGAVFVQPNALGHFLHVLLAQAGVGTVLALLSTAYACFDAGLKLLMAHGDLQRA